MIGRKLSHFQITAKLGEGGMGEVYRAVDTRLGREVAVKVLPAGMAAIPERLERFQREAKALAALDHPGVVSVYSVEESDGLHFLTMQLVDGEPLAELIPEGGLPAARTLEIAVALAEALAVAHEEGIVHRDLKPANVMIAKDGRVKILDFGLARMTAPSDAPGAAQLPTELLTRQGVVMGTAPYMSPEQISGETVDERSDIFSLGVLLYETACGRRPFAGRSSAELASAILHQDPQPLGELRSDLAPGLGQAIQRCLEKKPENRFASGHDLCQALRALDAISVAPTAPEGSRRARGPLERPLVRIGLATAGLVLLAALGWLAWRTNRASWARNQALPEVTRLAEEGRYAEATSLAERAERHIPGDPVLAELLSEITVELDITSEPSGAAVEVQPYGQDTAEARLLGATPIRDLRLPKGTYRWRFSKPGSETIDRAMPAAAGTVNVVLPAAGSVPSGMVWVPRALDVLFVAAFGLPRPVELDDYYIQRYEVTNREYEEFVDAGAYRREDLWSHSFVDGDLRLTWEEAMARLVDRAGQPGPATWEVGAYPAGQDDWPVGGVSWYEAAAYCEHRGLGLPTLDHWFRAAGASAGPFLLPVANFDYQGPLAVGASGAMSPSGAYDMAGNVKEWAWNASSDGLRYSLGGGWGEPEYMFGNIEPRSPFDRTANDGFRCAQYPQGQPDARSAADFDRAARDYRLVPPVPDETFELFVRMQQYAPKPLDARVEKELDSDPDVRTERVSFTAAYGEDRVVAYLWLPRDIEPPYQTLLLFPGSEGLRPSSGEVLEHPQFYDFLVRSGRAVVHPVYDGMYGRWAGLMPTKDMLVLRDFQLRWSQDVRRTLDYLETRPDIDLEKVGFFGSSLGAWFAPIPLAVEPRLKLAVLVGGALSPAAFEPEVDTVHYAPRVRQPLLLLCGRYDYFFPLEASQKPFFERLGTPAEHKRHVVVDSGHSVPRAEFLKEVLGWLDRYFGPAR